MYSDYEIDEAFRHFKLNKNVKKTTVDRLFNQMKNKYLAGKISTNDFTMYDMYYSIINKYFISMEKDKQYDKQQRKKVLLYKTKKLNEEMEKRRKKCEYKGKLWVGIEELIWEDSDYNFEEYIDHIREQVLTNLDDKYKSLYNEFISLFLKLWKVLYVRMLEIEKNLLNQGRIDNVSAFSFGEDELTDRYYEKNKQFLPIGKFSRLLELTRILSELIPDEKNNFFLDIHLSLMSKFFIFQYSVSYYGDTPIYSFIVNTRLLQYKEEYFHLFDKEILNGVRKNLFVNNEEVLTFIKVKLDNLNKEKHLNINIKKKNQNL